MSTARQWLMVSMAIALNACSDAPIAPPDGTATQVIPASAQTTSLTNVTEWRVFYGFINDSADEMTVFGVDANGAGVAEMQLVSTGSDTAPSIESTVMNNGAWSDRVDFDLTSGNVAAQDSDHHLSRALWTQFSADSAAYQTTSPFGSTHSAATPYSYDVCDDCGQEKDLFKKDCSGLIDVYLGPNQCPNNAPMAADGTCPIPQSAINACTRANSILKRCNLLLGHGPACNLNEVAVKVQCDPNDPNSLTLNGDCACATGTVPFNRADVWNTIASGSSPNGCLPICAMSCECGVTQNLDTNFTTICTPTYGVKDAQGSCDYLKPWHSDAVPNPNTKYCCPPPPSNPPVIMEQGWALGSFACVLWPGDPPPWWKP
jgi:hypothetical protein